MTETFAARLARQDDLITRRQALTYLSDAEVDSRLGRRWQVILPGVYATFTGPLTDRHRARAALLHAGDGAMLTDLCALRAHKLPDLPADPFIRLLVRDNVQRASRDFVVIRRTTRLPRPVAINGLPTAPTYRALCEFAVRHDDEREALAVAAAAVQQNRAATWQLVEEAKSGPARGRPRLLRIIEALSAGVRSLPEAEFRQLVLSSRLLAEPLWNPLIRLSDGHIFSPDALWIEAGLIHETNGRNYHAPERAGEDVFENMQRRHDILVAAGLTVLHNSANRIFTEGRNILAELETCYARLDGDGLPPGVVILRAGPPGTPSNVTSPLENAG